MLQDWEKPPITRAINTWEYLEDLAQDTPDSQSYIVHAIAGLAEVLISLTIAICEKDYRYERTEAD